MPPNETFSVLGRRSVRPLSRISGTRSFKPRHNLPLLFLDVAHAMARRRRCTSACLASPTTPATFSVPARHPVHARPHASGGARLWCLCKGVSIWFRKTTKEAINGKDKEFLHALMQRRTWVARRQAVLPTSGKAARDISGYPTD